MPDPASPTSLPPHSPVPDAPTPASGLSGARRGMPVRYDNGFNGPVIDPNGPFVAFEDYARLAKRLELAKNTLESALGEYEGCDMLEGAGKALAILAAPEVES